MWLKWKLREWRVECRLNKYAVSNIILKQKFCQLIIVGGWKKVSKSQLRQLKFDLPRNKSGSMGVA